MATKNGMVSTTIMCELPHSRITNFNKNRKFQTFSTYKNLPATAPHRRTHNNNKIKTNFLNVICTGVILLLQRQPSPLSSAAATKLVQPHTIISTTTTASLYLLSSIAVVVVFNSKSPTVEATITGTSLGTVGQGIKIVLPDRSGELPELVLNSNDEDANFSNDFSKTKTNGDADIINSAVDSQSAQLISQLTSSKRQREQVLDKFVAHGNRANDEQGRFINQKKSEQMLPPAWLFSASSNSIFQHPNSEARRKRAAMVMPVETYGPTSSNSASVLAAQRRHSSEPIGYPGCGIQHYKPNYLMQPASVDAAGGAGALRSSSAASAIIDPGSLRAKRRVEAVQHSWPWQADLFFYRTMPDGTKQRAHLCGATLIDRWHVVTAAHCNISRLAQPLFGEVPSEYYVRLGQHKRSALGDHVQEIRIKHWRDHEMFNDSVTHLKTGDMQFFLFNDIAFLTLERPASLSPEVYPICLDFNERPVFDVGATCYASGWSLDEFDYEKWLRGDYLDVLNESKSKIADAEYCRKHHGGFNETVTLCTKYAQGHYSCHGDSGGPLQCESNGRFFLVGIVSYDVATSCRETGMTFFSRVSGLQAWIEARLIEDMLSL